MLDRVIAWREKSLTDRQMTSVLALFIGFLASVAGYVLHSLISLIQRLLTEDFVPYAANWLYLVFPVIGIYLTMLFIKYVVRDNISHGITRVLYAISSRRSKLRGHNCWSSIVASAITIGFGGSVGAEAPIVLTGSAIGSRLGQLFHVDKRTMMLLVGCGASAAISGIFKAPIAGLVFTLEVLMIDMTMSSLVPILISSITADIFSYLFTGTSTLFAFHIDGAWSVERVPGTLLLGIFCGLVSLYFMRTMTWCEGRFARLKERPYIRLLTGGLVLSTLIFLFPSLYGEGYDRSSHQREDACRLATGYEWLVILRAWRDVGAVHIPCHDDENIRNLLYKWGWRLWRNVCTVALRRWIRRIFICPPVEHAANRNIPS